MASVFKNRRTSVSFLSRFRCSFNLLLIFITLVKAAQIGDGKTSLYTGNAIDENETRGSCLVDGVRFQSETSIPRDHPCHYCLCYQSQISCYWKQCSAPPTHCTLMSFDDVCNPSLYVCSIPNETVPEPEFGARLKRRKRRKRLFKRAAIGDGIEEYNQGGTGRLPVKEALDAEFEKAWKWYVKQPSGRHSISKRAIYSETPNLLLGDTSCTILGVYYHLGDVIGVSSDVCMECRCAAGKMFCSPKCCFNPFPLLPSDAQMSVFVLRSPPNPPPHPLHYVRNQLEGNSIV